MFDTSDRCCTCPATSSDPHSTLLWLSLWLLLVPGLTTSHFPTINCINHLPACKNPNHFEWVCFVPLPPQIPQPYFMSSAYFRHFWNYILLEVTALILIPTPQHISALTPFWFIYTVYYQSPIQSIRAGIQTHAHVWIIHTNTHQGTQDNCYGLDDSSNIWQLIGKGAHSHEFLYLDFCLTPVVVQPLETNKLK